jgi:NAD(P)-dependent dehydrogenase (short-subunit alcohol dehydrogenase family)
MSSRNSKQKLKAKRVSKIDIVYQYFFTDRSVLITGASEPGLGSETAISLAHANPAHLILTARSDTKIKPVQEKIASLNPPIDLSDYDSIREAASKVNGSISKLDILINNAGVMALPRFEKSKHGVEMQFATNHLGHFLFTALVFPKIASAGKGARIVNLSSDGHRIGPWRGDDYNFKDGAEYDMWSGYGQGKTANILFTRYLAAKLKPKGISSFAVHPGGKSSGPGCRSKT